MPNHAQATVPISTLSNRSASMLSLRDGVIAEWEKQVRRTIIAAHGLPHPVLIDSMPVLFEQLCCLLTDRYFLGEGINVTSLSAEHGHVRAHLTDFDYDALLAELQLFRKILFEALDRERVHVSAGESRALNLTLDNAMRDSVRGFVAATNSHRERYAAALAHDLRQPLANVTSAAELIARLRPSTEILDWVQRIGSNAKRMSVMLSELLDALSVQHGARLRLEMTEFDLAALAMTVVSRARSYQKARILVNVEPVVGFWNYSALERALENLINNAVRYGGSEKPVEVTVAENSERAVLSVRNFGPRIAPGQFEAIFQPYVRANDEQATNSTGWGLGLPYVRAVAQSHGGAATVFSEAETGTVFIIDVPVDARPFQLDPPRNVAQDR